MENDERTEQKAPKGKFRVIGVDTFSHEDWSYGDFDTKEEAIDVAKKKGGTMNKTHVYDDKGKHLFEAGTV